MIFIQQPSLSFWIAPIALLLGFFLASCNKPPDPVELVIEFGPGGAVVGETAMFHVEQLPFKPEEITRTAWYFGDGESHNSITASHVYEEPGTYEVIFLVELSGQRNIDMRTLGVNQLWTDEDKQTMNFTKPITIGE